MALRFRTEAIIFMNQNTLRPFRMTFPMLYVRMMERGAVSLMEYMVR